MKSRLIRYLLPTIAFAAIVQSSVYAQSSVTEADDAYHFKYWAGSIYNLFYTEWWYFNLYDQKDDIQAIFSYQVSNPLNAGGFGIANMAAVVYQGANIIPEADFYSVSSFAPSYSAANVTLGSNTISVLGPNAYNITGSSKDGRLSWNLYYERDATSWFAGDRVNVGPESWEQMSWLLYMPRASVIGTLTIDGRVWNIASPGYHDHNWGQWNFNKVVWNWAQYSQPGLTFDLGDFVGNLNGRASVTVAGNQAVFSASQYKLVHTKWAFDQKDNLPYPTQSVFIAQNADAKALIVMDVQKTEPLAAGPPPSLVIYESPAHFSGSITILNQGMPKEIPFEGNGFKEYTGITKAP